jgi:nitrile hydratase
MDSIHDMGGMHGFGRVEPEKNEPVFHAPWEGRMFGMAMTVPFALGYSDDLFRPAMERMEPGHYLSSSYYEKWYEAMLRILKERGAVTDDELAGGALKSFKGNPAAKAADVLPAILGGASQARPDARAVAQAFNAGDRVRTRSSMGLGHNRLPRYVRGRTGTIESVHGSFLVADRNSVGDQTPETLYTVVFSARDLWGGEAAVGDTLSLDCWESYLEPVG